MYTVDCKQESGFTRLTIAGKGGDESAKAITVEAIRLLGDRHPTHLLVDVRSLDGRMSPGAAYWHLADLAMNRAPHNTRIAIIDNEANAEQAAFFEAAAYTRGFTSLRHFTEESEARTWLLDQPSHVFVNVIAKHAGAVPALRSA